MTFLEDIVIRDWCRERGFALGPKDELVIDPSVAILECRSYGQQANPAVPECETAAWCVGALKEWDECLLWVTAWGLWPSSENWPAYYSARGVQGERRSLEIAPGHLFGVGETDLLTHFVRLVLENAWDAYLLGAGHGRRNRIHAIVSHDEWIEIRDAG
jgi:hypothetical protein